MSLLWDYIIWTQCTLIYIFPTRLQTPWKPGICFLHLNILSTWHVIINNLNCYSIWLLILIRSSDCQLVYWWLRKWRLQTNYYFIKTVSWESQSTEDLIFLSWESCNYTDCCISPTWDFPSVRMLSWMPQDIKWI